MAMLKSALKPKWVQIFLGGLVLFFATEQALKITGNINFFPTLIMVGAFLVPASMVIYFYEQEQSIDMGVHSHSPFISATVCFLVGGVIGVLTAGILEYQTLSNLGIVALLGVGLIEESCKLILPVILFLRGHYRSEMDGLLFGIGAGMGFAALETMGYGLVSTLQTKGDLAILDQVLLTRGLISPAGHAAWTGLVTSVLWRQRERTGKLITLPVFGYFLVAVVLHAVWDIVSSAQSPAIYIPGYLAIAGISLVLLMRRVREAKLTHIRKTLPTDLRPP